MSVVKSTSQEIPISSSSTHEYIGPGPSMLKDERTWKAYLSSADASTASVLHVNGEDISVGSLGFLYDYYGMTDETLQGPPSPGNSISSPAPSTTASEVILDVLKKTPVTSEKQEQHKTSIEEKQKSIAPVIAKPNGITIAAVSEAPVLSITGIASLVKAEQRHESCSSEVSTEMVNVDPDATVVTGSESYGTHQISHIAPLSVVAIADAKPAIVAPQEGVIINRFPAQNNVFQSEEKYVCILEAPTSIIQKRGEESLTYLNKGQFYNITFECKTQHSGPHSPKIKSIVHLVFREEKDPRNELAHWQYWHAQQPNPNQKAFDIDRNKCQNIEKFDEVGYNAVGFIWSADQKAKVVLRINCLSTDFSPQKGVKGIPLQLQVDTYENYQTQDAEVVHRGLCQIKIFRDKGAERKNKDESKTAEKRMIKYMKQNSLNSVSGVPVCSGVPVSHVSSLFQGPSKVTKLTSTTPLGQKPVVFVPKNQGSYDDSSSSSVITSTPASPPAAPTFLEQLRERESKRTLTAALAVAKDDLEDLSVQIPKCKTARVTKRKAPAVTIYVRKEEEKVYNALMLEDLTVDDLKHTVAMKYGMPSEMIKNVYKKTRKGILVNLDDQMVEQFVDEDDFIIQVNFDNQLGHFELTFMY